MGRYHFLRIKKGAGLLVKRRPGLGECFLWFVSFAPKEMNELFCFVFSERENEEVRLNLLITSFFKKKCFEGQSNLY